MTVTDQQFADLSARLVTLEASLLSKTAAIEASVDTKVAEVDTFYLMWAGALIFLMQSGFAVLSAGSIRSKNVKNILLKNLLDACVGALLWYFIGYGLAYDADCDAPDHKCNSALLPLTRRSQPRFARE